MKVVLNDVEIQGRVEDLSSEDKKVVRMEFQTSGSNEYHLFSELIGSNSLNVSIEDLGMAYKAKVQNYSRSYQDKLADDTLANFSLELHEQDEEGNEWNTQIGTSIATMQNWVRTRAISEILIEKGYFTAEEYNNKIDEVTERDQDKMLNFINTGK
ncbi:DUF3219 family protein [Peribacillus loiseleuriae]|uniref:Uncharacterized protein n=1 Tax=Peribacillus loiseleuriae TaxID=1679170 RepID=A0A0K9GSE5_9BACI|nr:DUF3219 family protein [Peribacillus loiseleuriae]KMY49558.1 hypothetical protein AC625_08370 [Peribacillus loiseleuriae]